MKTSRTITLTAHDQHTLDAFHTAPEGAPRGGLVVVQEIFGVNAHIRAVCERFSREGYVCIAPALFDRIERGVELGYDGDGFARGRAIAVQLKPEMLLADVRAAVDALRAEGIARVAVVGYCLGGSVAWRAADALPIDAAVAYYGGNIPKLLELSPKCPVLAHFGERDAFIPLEGVRALEARHPSVDVQVYAAEHGFNCDARDSYDAKSAALALERTLDFLARNMRTPRA